jgi:hypothetical protein
MPKFYSDIRGEVTGVKQTIFIDIGDETTNLTTGTAKKTFRFPYNFSISEIRASVNTAPTGEEVKVDINQGGTSILNTIISIDENEKTSATASVAYNIKNPFISSDDEMTIDIDQVGSTAAGKGLKLLIIGTEISPNEKYYHLSSSVGTAATVNEGASVIFTMRTYNVADSTTIAYAVTGIQAEDVSQGLTGNLTVSSDSATQTMTLAADGTTEGTETITFTAQELAIAVAVADTSVPVPPLSNTYSLDFDGTDDVVTTELELTNRNITISAWVKQDSAAFYETIFGDWEGGNTPNSLWVATWFNDGIWFRVGDGAYAVKNVQLNNKGLTAESWHHIVLVLGNDDGGNEIKIAIYVDGTEQYNVTEDIEADPGTFNLGFSNAGKAWNGHIDECAVWSTQLSEEEVSALYNDGTPTDLSEADGAYQSEGDLVAWWRMGDGDTYDTIEDNEGSYDATMANMTSGDIVEDTPGG